MKLPLKVGMTLAVLALQVAGWSGVNHISKTQVDSIRIDRGWCFGPCPVYRATIYKDGTVKYFGEAHADKMGSFKGSLESSDDVQRLGQLIDRLGFFSMKPSYTVDATCQPSITITVVRDGKAVRVYQYGDAGPREIWAIGALIDSTLSDVTEWKPVK